MRTIRTFIAVPLEPSIRNSATALMRRLQQPDDGIKWVPTDNLHLTLKFLGEVENTEVPSVCEVLRAVCAEHARFQLEFRGAGGLPDIARARVLIAGIDDVSGSLTTIVSELERRYAAMGFKPEPRDYVPHLTLGRTGRGRRKSPESVIERITAEQDTELGGMTVTKVQVFASFMEKRGPTYQVMDTVGL